MNNTPEEQTNSPVEESAINTADDNFNKLETSDYFWYILFNLYITYNINLAVEYYVSINDDPFRTLYSIFLIGY